MKDKYLVINIGSASKKYGLFGETELCGVHMEKTSDGYLGAVIVGEERQEVVITAEDYDNAGAYLMRLAGEKNLAQISDIAKIGIRIVAPGKFFQEDKTINDSYVAALTADREMAPLHIGPILEEIEKIKNWANGIPLWGISDSAFYKDMPAEAKLYGLSKELAAEYGIYRYGYHGISMSSVLDIIQKMQGNVPDRMIICHLGSGSTITALKNGKPIDTSMGFTPLEGVPMGSRVGNIDAAAVLYLLKKGGFDASTLETVLYRKSGLLGLSGKTQFVKELIDLEKAGDASAGEALAVFARSVRKFIGAYTALLGGLDCLVFTATIGERSDYMRAKICADFEYLGVVLDDTKNTATISTNGFIQSDNSQTKIAVVVTEEMAEMVKRCA